jgi:hypothetical protein
MKKVLAIALIAGSLAACNNNGDKKETKDTTRVDSPAVVTPTPDTTMAPDTTKMSDTTHM